MSLNDGNNITESETNETIEEDIDDNENTDSANWQTSNSATDFTADQTAKSTTSESVKEISTAMSADSMDVQGIRNLIEDDILGNESMTRISTYVNYDSPNNSDLENCENDVASSNRIVEAKNNERGYSQIKEKLFKSFVQDKNEINLDLNKYFQATNNAVNVLTREPWPKDVQLFQPYEVEQILLPDNANCLAVQTFLKMCQLDYKVEARANADAMSPTGRVPFIKCGAFIVSELEGIVQFVGSKGISLTTDLDQESKADMRAYMTLVNNVLGSAELYLCWCDGETYNDVTKLRYGSVFPWPLNIIQTWTKRQEEIKRLKVIGWYQKTLEEVYNDVETCCQALTDRLDNNNYFFGNNPTELDALIYAHLFVILTTPIPKSFAAIVKRFPTLVHFCQTIGNELYSIQSSFPPLVFEKMTQRMVVNVRFSHKFYTQSNLKQWGRLQGIYVDKTLTLIKEFRPTELEGLIFGHLYTILTTPLPNAALANIVKNFPKLIDLITRLEKQYFQRETQH